jgi:AcrR family transcriptional regulator
MESKEKILKAARNLFGNKGFKGTTTQEIATLAEINHSLIFHYFKTKEGLWIAVKEDIEREHMESYSLKLSTEESFDQFLKHLIHNYISFYKNNPDIKKILNWQRLEFVSKETKEELSISDEFITICNCFREYQRRGDIDPTLDPRYITFFVFSVMNSASTTLGDVLPKIEHNSYLSFCKNRIKRGLKP